MSISVKVRLDDQFFKAGSLDAEALSWPTLQQFLRQFLQTRGVAGKILVVEFRDKAGQWHTLDESALSSAVIDGEKLVVGVVVDENVETTSTSAGSSSESDTRSNEEIQAKSQVDQPQLRSVASPCRRSWRRRAVKFMFFVLAALFVYSRIMVCSTATDAGKTEQLATLLTSLIAPSAFEREEQSAELQRVAQRYGAGAPLTDAEIHLFNVILERHESALKRAAAFDRQMEELSSCSTNLVALIERQRDLERQLKERAEKNDDVTSLSKLILEKALKFGERAKSHANELLADTRKSVADALRSLHSDDDDDDDGTRHTKKTKKTKTDADFFKH
jgi:hypothetical protein